jgi:hypothetical protein
MITGIPAPDCAWLVLLQDTIDRAPINPATKADALAIFFSMSITSSIKHIT